MKDELMQDIAQLQTDWNNMPIMSKKAMCDLVIPFRDKYSLKDSQALAIARDEISIPEIWGILKDYAD